MIPPRKMRYLFLFKSIIVIIGMFPSSIQQIYRPLTDESLSFSQPPFPCLAGQSISLIHQRSLNLSDRVSVYRSIKKAGGSGPIFATASSLTGTKKAWAWVTVLNAAISGKVSNISSRIDLRSFELVQREEGEERPTMSNLTSLLPSSCFRPLWLSTTPIFLDTLDE